MKRGTVIAIAALVLYLGFEAYAVTQVRHRMEPNYIYNILIQAQTAVGHCDVLKPNDNTLTTRFNKTLNREKTKLERQLHDQQPAADSDAITTQLQTATQQASDTVNQLFNENGCDHPDMVAHLRRYEIYARRSR